MLQNVPPQVNAGSAINVVLSSATGDSLSLKGTAKDEDGSVVSYLWSQVSGPGSSTILTPGSSSTFVTGLLSGTYVFQLTAVDNKGAVGVDSVTATVTQNNTPKGPNKVPLVNAGRDTTYDLTGAIPDSIHLSGSATDVDGTVVSYLWSQVSGPGAAIILNPGATSSYVIGVQSGEYVFQLTALDNNGATGVKMVRITVINPKTETIALNPSNNQDETVINSLQAGNNPSLQELPAAYWTNGGNAVETRSLLKFNLSGIPATATIKSAKLSLYAVPHPVNGDGVHADLGSDNAVYIRRITANWSSANLTWSNQPGTTPANQVLLPVTTNNWTDYTDLDVTGLIQDMVANGNFGMLLQLKTLNLYNIQNFASSKYSDASKHPRLTVEYTK